MAAEYLTAPPREGLDIFEAGAQPTLVVRVTDYPLTEMGTLFDKVFTNISTVFVDTGTRPVGPPFSLHTRMPTDTGDFEVGFPISEPLLDSVEVEDLTFENSELPAGRIAATSYLGAYEGLGDAWGAFMQSVFAGDEQAAFPFWEVYVTEPSPDADPATLRTDLYTLLV